MTIWKHDATGWIEWWFVVNPVIMKHSPFCCRMNRRTHSGRKFGDYSKMKQGAIPDKLNANAKWRDETKRISKSVTQEQLGTKNPDCLRNKSISVRSVCSVWQIGLLCSGYILCEYVVDHKLWWKMKVYKPVLFNILLSERLIRNDLRYHDHLKGSWGGRWYVCHATG